MIKKLYNLLMWHLKWKSEMEKCKKDPHYFATKYLTIDGKPFNVSKEDFDFIYDLWNKDDAGIEDIGVNREKPFFGIVPHDLIRLAVKRNPNVDEATMYKARLACMQVKVDKERELIIKEAGDSEYPNTYEYEGHKYILLGPTLMKHPTTRDWVIGYFYYPEKHGHIHLVREKKDFLSKFKKVKTNKKSWETRDI